MERTQILYSDHQTYTCAVTLISMEDVREEMRAVIKATVEATESRLMGQAKRTAEEVCEASQMEINKYLEKTVG